MSPQMTRQNARNGDWEQFPVDLPNFLLLVLPGKIKLYCSTRRAALHEWEAGGGAFCTRAFVDIVQKQKAAPTSEPALIIRRMFCEELLTVMTFLTFVNGPVFLRSLHIVVPALHSITT